VANNFVQFSEVIPQLRPDEEQWLRHQLEIVSVVDDKEFADGDEPEDDDPDDAEFRGCRAFRDMEDYDSSEKDAGFCYEFCTDETAEPEGWGRHLWIYADECGDLERIAHLVQKFLKQFRPNECWVLTYSETCSRPRVGEFGGGAMFVTAGDIKWQNAYGFIAAERAAFETLQAERAA
jgi:hypothetical protein